MPSAETWKEIRARWYGYELIEIDEKTVELAARYGLAEYKDGDWVVTPKGAKVIGDYCEVLINEYS